MKFLKYHLFILLFASVFPICLDGNICAAEKREGLLICVGGGAGRTDITFESEDGTRDNYSSDGFAFSARMGWCVNEYAFLYWDMKESA